MHPTSFSPAGDAVVALVAWRFDLMSEPRDGDYDLACFFAPSHANMVAP